MKKYILLLICALMGVTTFAQQEPNRMLITNKLGNITPFRIDNVDSISYLLNSIREKYISDRNGIYLSIDINPVNMY